jgi:hypothetical protein
MTAELTARAEGPAGCGRVEVEYVDPGRGRERRPLAACCSSRFERMSPVRGFASFRGQRNWPGWWWFSRTAAGGSSRRCPRLGPSREEARPPCCGRRSGEPRYGG